MGDRAVRRELYGVALLVFAAFLAGALVLQTVPADGSCLGARGIFGPVGACLRSAAVTMLGVPASLLLPLVPAAFALRVLGVVDDNGNRSWMWFVAGVVALLPIATALLHGAPRANLPSAGLWGGIIAFYAVRAVGPAGAWLGVVLGACALVITTLYWSPIRVLVGWGEAATESPRAGAAVPVPLTGPVALLEPSPEEMPAIDVSLLDPPARAPAADGADGAAEEPPREEKKKRERRTKATAAAEHAERIAAEIDASVPADGLPTELPPPDLLTPPPPKNADVSRRELDAMGAKLMDALRTFRVEGELVGRTTGPVVTQFEVAPAAGVKVRQIAILADDLALAMRAPSIRIVAPIPGKGAVGVEVPNPSAEMVAFRELIESREFQHARAALPIGLGKDLEGRAVIADLAKMPHLLIAGATGSGKSVCVNTIITSLVYRHTPQTLRFLMVDPKMVELSVYNVLPHLRHKVVTDNRDAAAVLKWAVLEMQSRYELLAANGARNIQDFNRRVQEGAPLLTPKRPNVAFEDRTYRGGILPYIVVVIDELADLMMTVQGEVETPLAMLAQKARAIGIHLILATQRPSVNVITGLIKANFPSRIAFRVASQVDSRTIIDGIGAEALLGNGDMLFIPPGKSEPARLQGAYISSEETERLMTWFERQREARRAALGLDGAEQAEASSSEPDILEWVRQHEATEAGAGDGESAEGTERDKLFRDAAEVVIQHQQGSTSLLQRRLKIGYGRAARIIDQLHAAGILSPPDGSKPRDVLVGLDDLDRICGAPAAARTSREADPVEA